MPAMKRAVTPGHVLDDHVPVGALAERVRPLVRESVPEAKEPADRGALS